MGTKIRCTLCNDIIEGDGYGHLITCKCGACFIDETPYYYRAGGNPENMRIVKEDGTEQSFINEPEPKVELKRIDKVNYYLDIAETVSERSTCLDSNYGAIIVKNDEVISSGFNGSPRGVLSCIDIGHCFREKEKRGEGYSICLSVHAEQNAIISASRKDMIGSTLYLVGKKVKTGKYVDNPEPCIVCKRMIINAGIETVVVRLDNEKTSNSYKVFYVNKWSQPDITT